MTDVVIPEPSRAALKAALRQAVEDLQKVQAERDTLLRAADEVVQAFDGLAEWAGFRCNMRMVRAIDALRALPLPETTPEPKCSVCDPHCGPYCLCGACHQPAIPGVRPARPRFGYVTMVDTTAPQPPEPTPASEAKGDGIHYDGQPNCGVRSGGFSGDLSRVTCWACLTKDARQAELASLRADVARLTRERDEARASMAVECAEIVRDAADGRDRADIESAAQQIEVLALKIDPTAGTMTRQEMFRALSDGQARLDCLEAERDNLRTQLAEAMKERAELTAHDALACAQLAQAQAERDRAQTLLRDEQRDHDDLRERWKKTRADAAAMREALPKIRNLAGWASTTEMDAMLDAALSTAAGAELLAERDRLRAEVKRLADKYRSHLHAEECHRHDACDAPADDAGCDVHGLGACPACDCSTGVVADLDAVLVGGAS